MSRQVTSVRVATPLKRLHNRGLNMM